MQIDTAAETLAQALAESADSREYRALKEEIACDPVSSAMLKEYERLQSRLQIAAAMGATGESDDARRFEQLGALLFSGEVTSRYLLCEMRLRQRLAALYSRLSKAAGIELPGV